MNRAIVVAVILIGASARAQEPALDPDREAADLYLQAIRAESLGKHLMALDLADQALDASPSGPHAAELRSFIDRSTAQALDEASKEDRVRGPLRDRRDHDADQGDDHIGARAGYVVSGVLVGTVVGFMAGISPAFTSSGDQETFNPNIIGALMLAGAAVGVVATLATMQAADDGSLTYHLWAGAAYGAWVTGGLLLLSHSSSNETLSAGYASAIAGGAVLATVLAATAKLTAGSGAAGLALGVILPLNALLFESQAFKSDAIGISILIASTLGLFGGELLNSSIHWSGSRWGLIFASSVIGGLLGVMVGLAVGSGPVTELTVACGDLLGFGVGLAVTNGMAPEVRAAPPPASPPWQSSIDARAPVRRAMFSFAF